jgi:hypothetical protein
MEDLADLLGEVGGGVEGAFTHKAEGAASNYMATPLGEPTVNALTSGAAQAGFNFMDLLLDQSKQTIGNTMGFPLQMAGRLGIGGTGPQEALARWEQDPLGRAEWENFIQDKPKIVQAALELGIDPTTYLGLGVGRSGARGLRAAAELPGVRNPQTMKGMATGLEAASFLWDELPYQAAKRAVNNPVTRPIGRAGKRGIERLVPKAFEYDPKTALRRRGQDIASAFDEKLSARGGTFRGMVPALVPGGTKSLAPIDKYDVPPFFAAGFPQGGDRLQRASYDAWLRLREKNILAEGTAELQERSNAGRLYPGVPRTAPPRDPSQLRDIASRLLDKATDPRLGFISPPPGGYRDPYDAMANIDEDNLRDIATIMAQVMRDFDNDTSNQVFQPLRRASSGMSLGKGAVTEKYGPGITPALPAAVEMINAGQLGDEFAGLTMPDTRFATDQGWGQGTVKEDRLSAVQAQVDAGKITPEQAADLLVGRRLAKGSPQIVEEAVGTGAGFLAAHRPQMGDDAFRSAYGPGGDMLPTKMDPTTGRAALPEGFGSQWETNRQAFDHFAESLFPGLAARPNELEAIRRAATEVLYDEMLNAAGPTAYGANAATKILQRKTPTGEETTKIGAWADPNDPSQIGNRADELDQRLPPGMYGKPSEKAKNLAEYNKLAGNEFDAPVNNLDYRRVTGKDTGGREVTNDNLIEMVEAMGGTPWRPNVKGGELPGIQRLIAAYHAGKDIPVGDVPAEDWYDEATREALAIVGPGNYEDAVMLLEIMAVTSSGTEVTLNVQRGLRAFAEWKLGSDDMIRNRMGLSPEQVDQLIRKGGTWDPVAKSFRSGMSASQKGTLTKLFETFVERRKQSNPATGPVQGGYKTHGFSGSFVINLLEEAVDYGLKDKNPALHKTIRDALDKAYIPFAGDRHVSRAVNQATSVNEMQSLVMREQFNEAAKQVGVRLEDLQAAVWYTVKDNQGFLRVNRSDDMAKALREAWNARKNPALVADVREAAMAANPDYWSKLDDVEFQAQIEDAMNQEVAYAIIQEELRKSKKALKKAFGTSDPLFGLLGLGDDTLGIISRSGRGLVPRRDIGSAIPRFVNDVEDTLGGINRGESMGATFAFDGRDFVPSPDTSGFAVALTSAGRVVSTRRRRGAARTVSQFLGKYGTLLEDEGMQDFIRFGVFPMEDGGASFDLTIIVPDESAAIALGRAANQKAIYHLDTGNLIDTGGSGEPVIHSAQEARRVIEDTLGPPKLQPRTAARLTARKALERGVTVAEMDAMNPVSILNRRVVKPIMERFQEQSEEYAKALAPKAAPNQGVLVPPDDPTSPLPAGIPGDREISTQANRLLMESFDDGEQYGTRMDRYYDEGAADSTVLESSGVRWGADSTYQDRKNAAAGNQAVLDVIEKYNKIGVDPLYSTPRDMAIHRVTRDLAKEAGVDIERQTRWDLFRAAWGEQALFSPRYHFGNLQGAWIQNALGGYFQVATPAEFLASYKITRGGLDDTTRKEALKTLKSFQIANKWGFEELPTYIQRGGVRSMTDNRTSRSAMGELAGRVTRSERVGKMVGRPFAANADMSQAIETVVRGGLWSETLDREMTNAAAVLDDQIRVMADRQGLQEFEFSLLNPGMGGDIWPDGVRTAKGIKQHLMDNGFQEGYAERAARNFSEAKKQAERVARAEVDKRQFSYDRTNLDEFVGKFIPFHYWYSRALRYYGEEAVRHPFLILNYMRANQGIEEAQNDPGLSARQKGFLHLMGTPLGFSVLMNPDALFGVVKVFGLQDTYTPDGETEAGGVISWLKARGLGLYPWIDGTLNMMGVYGDTFEPDLLGIRHKSLIGASVNFVRSQTGFEPMTAPYAQAMGQARQSVSTFVSQFTPDWLTQPVIQKTAGSQQDATMDIVIESRIVARNPQLTNGELLEIMADPDHPEYQAAFQEAAAAGTIQQLLNFTIPQQFRVREDSRDVRAAKVNTIYEAAEKQGIDPWKFKPQVGDVTFATQYRNLTGSDWKPGDYTTNLEQKQLIDASPAAKPFVLQEQEFHKLGGPRRKKIFDRYTAIRNGTDAATAGLDSDSRAALAGKWASDHGYWDDIEYVYALRDAFEQSHPEFGQYRGWQDRMYDLQNQLGGNLVEYRRRVIEENPNAAKYFEKKAEFITTNYPQDQWIAEMDRVTLSAEAYHTIAGMEQGRYDPAPTTPMGDQTLPAMTPPQTPYPSNPPFVSAINQGPNAYAMDTFGTWWNP